MKFTIVGSPRTKKNSMRVIRVRGVPRPIQSAQSCAWEESAVLQLRAQLHRAPSDLPVVLLPYYTKPVTMRALIYRDRAIGDLLNYLAAVSDALEVASVVADDKLILSLDGSRLLLDRENPRVELELTPL